MTLGSPSALPLGWETELDGSSARVRVRGELDRQTAPLLRDHLTWLAAMRCGLVELDLSCVSFMDVGGFDLLRDVGEQFADRQVHVEVTSTSPAVRRVLDLTGWPIPIPELAPQAAQVAGTN